MELGSRKAENGVCKGEFNHPVRSPGPSAVFFARWPANKSTATLPTALKMPILQNSSARSARPMADGYIPTSDAALDAWSQNFSTLITANPGIYGLVAGDATTIAAAVSTFHAAYLIAGVSGSIPKTPLNPAARTSVTVAAKDVAAAAMLGLLRYYAILIRNNPGVLDAQRAALQLTIPKTIPTPIPTPVTYPLLSLAGVTPGQATCYARDSGTPSIKAKPFGVVTLQMMIKYSATVPAGPTLADYFADFTKSPFVCNFLAADAGKTAWCYGRWETRTGLRGPWSAALSFVVPSGGA